MARWAVGTAVGVETGPDLKTDSVRAEGRGAEPAALEPRLAGCACDTALEPSGDLTLRQAPLLLLATR